jgi:DedD protein
MAEPQDALMLKRRARRRLVGAVALVLLVVIVLPVILDQEPKPVRHDLTVQIPSQDAGKFGARVVPPAPPAKDPSPAAPPEEKHETKAPEAPKAAARPAPKPAEKAASSRKDEEAKRALALLNDAGYVVPIGVFAQPENAQQVRDKASAAGFATYAEKVQSKDGDQTRVRAGPFGTRESAERARDKLKALGIPVGQVTSK